MRRMSLRMLVIALVVLGGGIALRMAWEEIAGPPAPSEAQVPDRYDCYTVQFTDVG